jgi:SsrA-binding protein
MVHLVDGLCKMEVALCKGKKLYDKRETERKKEALKIMDKMVKY